MTSVACGGTEDRIATRILLNVLRAGSGIPARYSSTFLGTILLFDAERRLRELDFFTLANAKASFKSVHQLMGLSAHSKQPDSLRLLDRRHLPQLGQHWLGHNPIHVNYGDGFARFGISHPAAQREICNVDFVIAQNRADFPDHPRYVSVAQVK